MRGIYVFSQGLPPDSREEVNRSLQEILSGYGVSSALTPRFLEMYLNEYWLDVEKTKRIDALRWSLEVFNKVASALSCGALLVLDDADFLIPNGLLGELLHLCRIHNIAVLANIRSLCDSKFDSDSPLAEYGRIAEFICLDLLPTDPVFASMCRSLLKEQAENDDPMVRRVADRLTLEPELFMQFSKLSGGQIGRFMEIIRFLASYQQAMERWSMPSRQELREFCDSVVTQMIQREKDPKLKDICMNWVQNLQQVLGANIETSLVSTWFKLPITRTANASVNEDFTDMLSIVRSGILAWILQCEPEERISVAKQSRFVPGQFKVSPLTGIADRISVDKALG